jgi:diaminopimelate epimerase
MTGFCKFHGFGNDYLIFAAEDLKKVKSINDFAVKVCNRHRGVGADGLAIFEKAEDAEADFSVRIVNPDGSEAGFSGNGTRCAVAHLFYKKIWQKPKVRLRLSSGIKKYYLIAEESAGRYVFAAEIGAPKFDSAAIPMLFAERRKDVIDFPLEIASETVLINAINVGNPAAVIFVADFDKLDWRSIGAEIEKRSIFIERTNVVFVRAVDRRNLEIRIWERGAGETDSSGTCSAAAAVMAAFLNKTDRIVDVHAVGGTTTVEWRKTDEIFLTGRADFVFCGEI